MKKIYKNCYIEVEKEIIDGETFLVGYIIDMDNNYQLETIDEAGSFNLYKVLENAKNTVDTYRSNPNKFVQDKLDRVQSALNYYSLKKDDLEK